MSMHVGVCQLTLHIAGSNSLKDKRQVVRSLVERLRRRYNAAVAEVDELDSWRTAVLGIAVVSNQAVHVSRQLDTIIEYVEATRLDAEVAHREIEIIPL